MRSRLSFWIGLSLLLLAGAWLLWPAGDRRAAVKNSVVPPTVAAPDQAITTPAVTTTKSAATAPQLFAAGKNATNAVAAAAQTNLFPYRLANTTKPIGELVTDGRVVLLANAFIDTSARQNFSIPKHLSAVGDTGAYIVQARVPMNSAYRAQLAAAGAEIVSYIPNNAYLVRMSAAGAAEMAGRPMTAAVLPYEPYYKISASLLGAAVAEKALPGDAALTLGLFADNAAQTVAQIEKLGGTVVATDRSPFGPMVRVLPPKNWTALAVLTGVQIVEPSRQRVTANDLARVTLGITTGTLVTNVNYGGLTGSNVVVVVSDSGIDAAHPDFSVTGNAAAPGTVPPSRVAGISLLSITDTNGHGTHVAGIIAGNGSKSYTVIETPQGSVTNADFRGKAPAARLFSVQALNNQETKNVSDRYLQEIPARTNALISNNSWTYSGDNAYDLAAASYDAAVRDALAETMGSQPVLFVFAAGNDGRGNSGGGGGEADTVLSPGTAKNVITVGALEQLRNLTNEVVNLDNETNTVWDLATDSDFQVAGYSARGNVGIGSEGTYGRFKPDVIAPGTFVISTRSTTWDQIAYYNPTNYYYKTFTGQTIVTNALNNYSISVPVNAVGVRITIVPNANSPVPFPLLPIYVKQFGAPTPASNDFFTTSNGVAIPPDGGAGYLALVQNDQFAYAVGNTSTNPTVSYDLITEITTTNDLGNYYQVLSNLNGTLGPYYRYESGTSMAAPAVSGVLALLQDYFTNTLHATPSPVLLKAMLINGARAVGNYKFSVTNAINFQGWGLPNVPNSVPSGITNVLNTPCASFFADQSPTNALATGDQQTLLVTVTTNDVNAVSQALRVTLAWTDPPGDPAAATKLVNNLDLVVTNLTTGEVYFGNDIPKNSLYNAAWNTNAAPILDAINNIENVFLSSSSGGSYSVTVVGRGVNVNAVTAHTNDVVQDYSLVISSGDGAISNALTITSAPLVSHLTDYQLITFVTNNVNAGNQTSVGVILLNQHAGASTPLLGTNTVAAGTNNGYAATAVITLGMTNQWHFYVVTNTTTFTNAAFVTFFPNTLSLPRMGVYADTEGNATRPEADIDLFVTTDSSLTNLNPAAITNADKSLSLGGTEFVAYTNSQPNRVYYIGVKAEDQEAAEYGFLSVFSQEPFSQVDSNGNQNVSGLLLPVIVPDGTPSHPGIAYVFALAVQPMQVRAVTVSNQIVHQNFGDLIGVLNHSGKNAVLNNHNGLFNLNGAYTNVYNDANNGLLDGSHPTDGPGSLQSFQGKQAVGPWIMTMVDDSQPQTGAVTAFSLLLEPHKDFVGSGVRINVRPGEFFVDYIDVPAGAVNLTVSATNQSLVVNATPVELYVKPFAAPVRTDTNNMALLTNCVFGTFPTGTLPGNAISTGPPLVPGRYFVGVYNPGPAAQDIFISAAFIYSAAAKTTTDFASTNATAIIDDAVSYSSIFVTNLDLIQSFQVGLRVDHPRISDLVFHLISPDGTRYLLMENRGALSTNGAGTTTIITNIINVDANGDALPNTNYVNVGLTSGTLPITYNFYTVPDRMTVYYGTNVSPLYLIYDTGLTNNPGSGQNTTPTTINVSFPSSAPGTSTYLTIVMNESGNTNQTAWTYTAGGVQTYHSYLTLTDDTNLTLTPIKFAPPPFVPAEFLSANFVLGSFDTSPAGDYVAPATITDLNNWTVFSNQVSVVADASNAASGSNFLALANGVLSNSIPTVPGLKYALSYYNRGPGIVGWWRGESNAVDSVGGNNGTLNGVTFTNGMVGSAFKFNGTNKYVSVPDAPVLNPTNAITVECWLYRSSQVGSFDPIVKKSDLSQANGYAFEFANSQLLFWVYRTSGGWASSGGTVPIALGQWYHVAGVYDGGQLLCYTNGQLASSSIVSGSIAISTNLLGIGRDPGNPDDRGFDGELDEVSIYNRAISASEIKAIYQAGAAGKFDPLLVNSSPAQSLAEASIVMPGISTNTFFGNNTAWQQQSISFTATGSNTPVVISGIEPGMLFDSFVLASLSANNLYYQPEVSIASLNSQSAYGLWQLEIQDDRVGAGLTNTLVSWQMEMVFANTNAFTPPFWPTNVPSQTNYTVNELTLLTVTNTAMSADTNAVLTYALVPALSGAAISAGGIITWIPSEAQGPGFYTIQTIVTDTTSATTATNRFTVTVNEVNLPPVFISPTNNAATNIFSQLPFVLQTVVVDPDLPVNPLTYILFGAPSGMTISTNGLITWTPATGQSGTTNVITIVVTDTNAFALTNQTLSATNIFTVNVSSVSGPFAFTQPAQSVTGTNAQLNGMATPNGLPATAWFEWGTNTAYGNQTPPASVGAGYNVVYKTNQISGLVANVPYHFRLVVSNAQAVVYGFDQILDQANVVVWGANYVGQGNVPTGLSNVVAIAGAYDHSLALKNNGTAVAWGDNTFGQSTVPTGLSNLVAVAGGAYYSLALKNNGTVTAWGANILAQTNVPPGLNNVVTVAGGTYSSLALKNNGAVVAWGANFFGLTNVPASLINAVAVAGGGFHSLAINNDGTVTAWGDNSSGQTNLPAGLSNVVAIAGGSYHSLALKNNGTVMSWGDNSAGQTNVPPGLTNVVAIAAGGFHSLALKSDGKIVTWGDNSSGQSSVPANLTNAVAIASGYFHSLALTPQSISSLTNPIVLNLTNGVAQTNTVLAGGTIYYRVNVPTNADFATNILLFTLNGTLNVWFTTNTPPTIGSFNDSLLFGAATNGISILSTTSTPTNIVSGSIYYLGVNNTNSVAVNYGIEVDFHFFTPTNPPPPVTNIVFISSIVYTNITGTNGFLLTWFAPSNALFQVQWTTVLSPATWNTFTNPPAVGYNPNVFTSPTNTQFNFFDNGTQTGGFGPTRFYRLILLAAPVTPTNTAPVLPAQSARIINPLAALIVTNTATDADLPTNTLIYTLSSSVIGTNVPTINTNTGVITWTPTLAQAGTSNTITTIVTDNGTPNLSATNSFAVIVNPIPSISGVTFTNIGGTNGFLVKWYAPTNDRFQVQWTTNLAPAVWLTFSNIVTYTGPATPTNGLFTFFDDGTQTGGFSPTRFYRLILLGAALPTNTAPVLPAQATRTVTPLATLTVTNTATDTDLPTNTLVYTLSSTVIGTNVPTINTNTGVITWTPLLAQAGTSNTITTIVTDNGVPPLSATNSFAVIVNPIPSISSAVVVTNGLKLTWSAPTNNQFNVQWATNLAPPVVWTPFAGIITSTNGTFTFTDTNVMLLTKFYELILLP